MMTSVFDRELLVVTGKGGVGKTTLASALGLLAAERGLRTIVVEVGEQSRLPRAVRHTGRRSGRRDASSQENLWSISIDPDRALLEWLQSLGGRVSGRVLASSSTFQYFAAAAPGAKELVSMVKIWELTQGKRRRGRARSAATTSSCSTRRPPGTRLACSTRRAPSARSPASARSPDRRSGCASCCEDPARSSYVAVAQATEMAVTETLELQETLGEQLGRELDAVIVNGMLPQRFSAARASCSIARARDGSCGRGDDHVDRRRGSAISRRAAAVSERARFQHNQLARLRRRSFDVIGVPFQFTAELDLARRSAYRRAAAAQALRRRWRQPSPGRRDQRVRGRWAQGRCGLLRDETVLAGAWIALQQPDRQ